MNNGYLRRAFCIITCSLLITAQLDAVPPTVNLQLPTDTGNWSVLIQYNVVDTDGGVDTAVIQVSYDSGITYADAHTRSIVGDSGVVIVSGGGGDTYYDTWFSNQDLPNQETIHVKIRILLGDGIDTAEDTSPVFTIDNLAPDTVQNVSLIVDPVFDTILLTWTTVANAMGYIVWRDTTLSGFDSSGYNMRNTPTTSDTITTVSFVDTPGPNIGNETIAFWYVQAVDTLGNAGPYSDSVSAEYILVEKTVVNVTRGGIPSDTIPGATIMYQILVSNTEGYSPVTDLQIKDIIPANTDYSESSMQLDTGEGFIDQTDISDTDQSIFQKSDSEYIFVDLSDTMFNTEDTVLIRFKVIIR